MTRAALDRLRAFTNSVKAQAGKKIGRPDANSLIACAQTAGNVVKAGMIAGAQLTAQDAALYGDDYSFFARRQPLSRAGQPSIAGNTLEVCQICL